ncbi:hypothetical protein SASPL_145514 [Salvia splendens]|uniref:Uncharacterized protein n=1 Tax=Salvia splendens TaxID=180675 RepID=A0A8X8WIM9_SALSN|nr:hypothetical protein SASPL_145514 [Salvia splendens]
MLGGLSVSESAAEVLLLGRNSLLPCGFPALRRPVSVASPRRENEYLKAMEFLKKGKYQTLKGSDSSSVGGDTPRGKKSVKRIVREEDKSGDELTAAEENSRNGKKGAWYKDDTKRDDKQNIDRDLKIRNRKISDGSESESLSVERDAFKPLELGDDALGKPRVTRVDMEERIQKLAK